MRTTAAGIVVLPRPKSVVVLPCVRCGKRVTILTHKRRDWTGLCAHCGWEGNEKVEERLRR